MNFAQMLLSTVTPLSDYAPPKSQPKKAPHKRSVVEANLAKHTNTVATYRAAWREDEWLPTAAVESRLGRNRSCCLPVLRAWEKEGLVEGRKVLGNNGRWNRKLGVEWRWR